MLTIDLGLPPLSPLVVEIDTALASPHQHMTPPAKPHVRLIQQKPDREGSDGPGIGGAGAR
jgi:hypothetical protein